MEVKKKILITSLLALTLLSACKNDKGTLPEKETAKIELQDTKFLDEMENKTTYIDYKLSEFTPSIKDYKIAEDFSNVENFSDFGEFTERFNCAKSSISEDIAIVKETFDLNKAGLIETVSGINGGVRYITDISEEEEKIYINELIDELNDPKRILPGGYFYLSDIITNPVYLKKIG